MPINDALRNQIKAATEAVRLRSAKLLPLKKEALKSHPLPDFVTDLFAQLGLTGLSSLVGGSTPAPKPPQSQTAPQSKTAPQKAATTEHTGAQFLSKSLTNHAGTRSYKLYIPSSYHGQAMPLMVMLHGCTQHPDDFAAGTRMNEVAEERQCFVVYPAQSQAANASKCWNWFNAVDQQRDTGEPAIIADITRAVIADYHLDSRKVYVAGLSAGGAMAIIMGNMYPDIYAAVGVHSGLPYASAHDIGSAFAAMQGAQTGAAGGRSGGHSARLQAIPIIVFHGDRDTTVNASNGERLIAQHVPTSLIDNGSDKRDTASEPRARAPDVIVEEGQVKSAQGRRYTRTSHHHPDGHAIAEHWVIHGAGHAWAGGSGDGSYTDTAGPDATREMMRFFYTHPR